MASVDSSVDEHPVVRKQREWAERFSWLMEQAQRIAGKHFTFQFPERSEDDMADEEGGARRRYERPGISDMRSMGAQIGNLIPPPPPPPQQLGRGLTLFDLDFLIRQHEDSAEARVRVDVPALEAAANEEGHRIGRERGMLAGRCEEQAQIDHAMTNVIHHLHELAGQARRGTEAEMRTHLLSIETLLGLVVERFNADEEHPGNRGERDRAKVLPIPDHASIERVGVNPLDDKGEPMPLELVFSALLDSYAKTYGEPARTRMVAAGDFSDQLSPLDFVEPAIRV